MIPSLIRLALLAGASIAIAGAASAATPAEDRAAIDRQISAEYPALETLYRDLHAHPELSSQETRTAALLAAKMRALGFTVTEKVGGTGVVAIYRNGEGPTVMLRTEMDALPVEEKSGLPYASRAQGERDGKTSFIAHSCGHDIHMASWLGTAEALIALKQQWHGTLMFVAQPAEETLKGARAMIADGLFKRFPKPDYAFAIHVWPAEAGTVLLKDGPITSNSDAMQIVFKGRGGHGSMPNATIDPVVMGGHFISDIQTVISREKDPNAFGVITVGSLQSGAAGNIIPDDAVLKLTLRSYAPEVRALLLDGVARTANAVASMARAPAPSVEHLYGSPAVVNDHALVARAGAMLQAAGGDTIEQKPALAPGWTASEDFSAYGEAGVPSIFYMVGAYDAKTIAAYKAKGEPLPTNHSPYFAPDPKITIPTAIRTLSLSALMALQ